MDELIDGQEHMDGQTEKWANRQKLWMDRWSTTEQHALKAVNNCLNMNIYSYLETSGGQSSNLYFNVVHFFNTSINQTSVAAEDH